jgi:radical SAM superfamily enzyme YgiQ (UPF0313 family)
MKVCLVAPATYAVREEELIVPTEATRFLAEHPPIGVLSLAAALERRGIIPSFVDLNRLYFQDCCLGSKDCQQTDFYSMAVDEISKLEFDVVGFGTMCSTYPLTLRIARKIKRLFPSATVLLGGPQASVVDVATLEAFPFVDLIVRGEAEETLPQLLESLASKGKLSSIPGIAYREAGRVVRNPEAPLIEDLDSLPVPAFHLHKGMIGCEFIPLELGRGCPFACTFCSTNDFFRRRFRLKSSQRLIEQMSLLQDSYGTNSFDLIHDMFTVDRRKVWDFCEALLSSERRFLWSCSARTDCVDSELLELMYKAGCRGIFFGVESGSDRMQKIIRKNLDLGEASAIVEQTGKTGIEITVSMITGYPEELKEDLEQSVDFVMNSARFDHVEPQINILAPLAGTPLLEKYRNRLILDDIFSDMSHQGWHQDPADRALIGSYPSIFPNFYGIPSGVSREYLQQFCRFFMNGVVRFRWLLVALHQESGNLLGVFDDWLKRRKTKIYSNKYYSTREFPKDFQSYVKEFYLRDVNPESIAVAGLLEYHEALVAAKGEKGLLCPPENHESYSVEPESVPYISECVRVMKLKTDVNRVIECLRTQTRPLQEMRQPTTLVIRQLSCGDSKLTLIPKLSAQILEMCDGRKRVKDIVNEFCGEASEIEGIPSRAVCLRGLGLLGESGIIRHQMPDDSSRPNPHPAHEFSQAT